ncbi:MAG: TonB-dependent receptor [Armatimonadota bacterium]|nr:TonB-dependent receptor [Armatimonadota bacterium]
MHSRFFLVVILAVALCSSASPIPALAQEPPPEFELPDVVSPARRPQPAAASPASVSVLTAADLQRLGVRTVGEALAYLPETLARAYGGAGSLITPSIRGSSAEQVLVLLDGVPLNNVLGGTVDLSTIPVAEVERIEVLRGPFSAIYGSGALGGVVSVITRRRGPATVTLGGGSAGAAAFSVSTGGGPRVALRYEGATGDRANSDLRAGWLSLRLGDEQGGRRWDATMFASLAARGVPGSVLFPTPLARQDDRRVVVAFSSTHSRGPLSDRLRGSLAYDGTDYRDPTFGISDRHDGSTWSVEWQRTVRRGPGLVQTWGADGHWQRLSSASVGERSAGVVAAYVQDDRTLRPRLLLSTGLRADWHSIWGLQINPRAGLVYFLRPEVRLRLAVGRTFRGPALADLYYPFDGFARGNPGLRPEQAWSADAGAEVVVGGLSLRATAFWSDVRDLIIWVPDAFFVFSPQNVGAASIWGGSLEADGAMAPGWRVRGSVTIMRARDAATGFDLPNRPRVQGTIALTHTWGGGASLTAAAVALGERFADAANVVKLPAYVATSLVAHVPISAEAGLRVVIQNLFDVRYEPLQGYPAPGRSVFVEFNLRR